MKRWICIALTLALALLALSGCDRRSETDEEGAVEGEFSPETTAVGGLTQAVEEEQSAGEMDASGNFAQDLGAGEMPATEDQPIVQEDSANTASTNAPKGNSPFASPTPQPNASVEKYREVKANGLGFRFRYPNGWVNIPGRSTVCYVQPLDDGTVYPARVTVTMKRMPHAVGKEEVRTQFANYFKKLMAQYDSSTFKVNTNLSTKTKFMGKAALSTTYLAYDGQQEIKGYAITTYFERYIFVFHFVCAYNDYSAFGATLRYMRDSVRGDNSLLAH